METGGVEGDSLGGVDNFGALDVEVGDLFGGERTGEGTGFAAERRWLSFGRRVGGNRQHPLGFVTGKLSSHLFAQHFIPSNPHTIPLII